MTDAPRSYMGTFAGFVRDVDDPEQRGRVRFFIPEAMGNIDDPDHWSEWARPRGAIGGAGVGAALHPFPNAGAGPFDVGYWIEFRDGDLAYPVYGGAFWGGGTDVGGDTPANYPEFSRGARNVDPAPRPGVLADGGRLELPDPWGAAVYPHNRGLATPAGHLVELDDTPGAERLLVRSSGGAVDMADGTGNRTLSIPGRLFTRTGGSVQHDAGERTHKVDGEHRLEALRLVRVAEQTLASLGATEVSAEETALTINGALELAADALEVLSAGLISLAAGGNLGMSAPSLDLAAVTSLALRCPAGATIAGALPGPPVGLLGVASEVSIASAGAVAPVGTTMVALNTAATTAAPALAIPPLTGVAPYLAAILAWANAVTAWINATNAAFGTSLTQHRIGR